MTGARIRPCKDGPLLVRGEFVVTDEEGTPLTGLAESVALCRCGKSQVKPFCDGTHKQARFRSGGAPAVGGQD